MIQNQVYKHSDRGAVSPLGVHWTIVCRCSAETWIITAVIQTQVVQIHWSGCCHTTWYSLNHCVQVFSREDLDDDGSDTEPGGTHTLIKVTNTHHRIFTHWTVAKLEEKVVQMRDLYQVTICWWVGEKWQCWCQQHWLSVIMTTLHLLKQAQKMADWGIHTAYIFLSSILLLFSFLFFLIYFLRG